MGDETGPTPSGTESEATTAESRDSSRAGTDEDVLMPGSAPDASPRRPDRPADKHTTRYGSTDTEGEFAALGDQLEALDDDIDDARTIARRAVEGPELTQHADDEAPPPARGEVVTLPDGARIRIRPIEPADAQQLGTLYEDLSAVSRYRRFLSPIAHLNVRQLDFLTDVDHETHEALIAVDATTGEGVGVGRYLRDPDDAGQAEVVVVVADPWQDRGAGTALVERLTARARAAGVDRFTARMLIGNQAGRQLLDHVAEPISEREHAGMARLTSRLKSRRETTPSPPARAEPSRPSRHPLRTVGRYLKSAWGGKPTRK
jgi:RimJ/RimL family protein N-acetyltransferase